MTRRKSSAQHKLATQSMELAFAAPLVVARRLGNMALAGQNPSAAQQRDMQTMGTEKVMAFWQSWAAMGWEAWRMQMNWMQALMRNPMSMPALGDPTRLLAAGLAPVHRKAVANARRLSRQTASPAARRG